MQTATPKAAKKPQIAAPEPWLEVGLAACACSQLRRTARTVSALYDQFLDLAGLTVTQYALLVTIARNDRLAKTDLAELLGMDRTTLTRNLRPLERDGLIVEKPGKDKREHQVTLTSQGRKKLEIAFGYWAKAQQAFLVRFGDSQFQDLQMLLKQASQAASRLA